MISSPTPYRIMYRLGFTPWDSGKVPGPLRELVEGKYALPPGRALDLGCGTGTHCVYLAKHGWEVTGVDIVARALAEAERKAVEADVHPAFVRGDITRLRESLIEDGFSLVLDVACFHGLSEGARQPAAREITAVSAPGATFLLFGFTPGKRGPLPKGIDRAEVERLFGASWEVLWEADAVDQPQLRGPLKNTHSKVYCLRKR